MSFFQYFYELQCNVILLGSMHMPVFMVPYRISLHIFNTMIHKNGRNLCCLLFGETNQCTQRHFLDHIKTPVRETKVSKPLATTPAASLPIKISASGSTSATTPESGTPAEKKNNNYWAYRHRDGPTALGTKQLPVVFILAHFLNITGRWCKCFQCC